LKRPYQVTGVVMMFLAAFMGYESLQLRYYSALGPGPGFFPFWLSVLLAFLASVMFFKATFKVSDPMAVDFFADRTGYLRIAAIIGSILFVIVLMEPLGFRLTLLAFYLFLLSVLRRRHIWTNLVIALGGSFGVYQVFDRWLATPLPTGVFGF
jgi:putative tricarboxylic transport membrane protein